MKKCIFIILWLTMALEAGAQSNISTADFLFQMEEYGSAAAIYDSILDTETEDSSQIYILGQIIECCSELEDYESCLEYDKRLLILAEEESLGHAGALWNLCIHNYLCGYYEKSAEYGKKAIKILNNIGQQGEGDDMRMRCCKAVGAACNKLSRYKEALYHETQYQKLCAKIYGSESSEYANSIFNLGFIYWNIENLGKSIEYFSQAASMYLKMEGEQVETYRHCLSFLANAHSLLQNHDKAKEYARRCCSLSKKYDDSSTMAAISAIESMGKACHAAGQLDSAIIYYSEAISKCQSLFGFSHYDHYILLGRAFRDKGDLSKSLQYLRQAEEIYSSQSDIAYPALLYERGKSNLERGNYQEAYRCAKTAYDIYTAILYKEFCYMTAEGKAGFWKDVFDFHDLLLESAIEVNTPESREEAYNSLLLSKGILLASELQLQDVVAQSNNQRLIKLYETFRDTKRRISKESDKGNQIAADSLSLLADKYESEIIECSYRYGDIVRNLKITLGDIKANLGSNDVAIEFFYTGSGKLGALVMKKDFKSPRLVMLSYDPGSAQDIEGIYSSSEIYDNIWKPLGKFYDESSRIYFSPAGRLHTIAIEYARTSDSTIISDKYKIYRMSSTRGLALGGERGNSAKAVIYGGIQYSTSIDNMVAQSRMYAHSEEDLLMQRQYLPYNGNIYAQYLPGTLAEASSIDSILASSNIATELITGAEANEESFKALSGRSYRIMHIATHGFYDSSSNLRGDKVLEASGLLFSGCNNASEVSGDIDDGVLSAWEISLLDFGSVDMVVMSACETGLGEISNDGVFGLQRGFKKAGVNTIVMSLWPVSDKATKAWMIKFYENIAKGMQKRDAFVAAQQDLRKQYKHPGFWAAFIMLDGQ